MGNHNDMTVREAKFYLIDHIEDKGGVSCLVCGHLNVVRKRKITPDMASKLRQMWKSHGSGWCHWTELSGNPDGNVALLRFWGLVERKDETKVDDIIPSGYWRVTRDGGRYITDQDVLLHKYCHIYKNKCIGQSGPLLSFRDCLAGRKFNLREMLDGES